MNKQKNSKPILERLKHSSGHHKPTGKEHAFWSRTSSTTIKTASTSQIVYENQDGQEGVIHLDKPISSDKSIQGYSGRKGLLSSPPWIEFFDEVNTRFEFETKMDAVSFITNYLTPSRIKIADVD